MPFSRSRRPARGPAPVILFCCFLAAAARPLDAQPATESQPNRLNVVFILCDDHRFDCLGAAGHPFLETPHLDALADSGTRLTSAYVTTSLCSPSRASILTGQYAHNHHVIDNYHEVDPNLSFFPQDLQAAGYQTAFIGKWHMGGDDDQPQRGFDHWISFKGQGTYWPDGHGTTREVPQTTYDGLNINGQRVKQNGYITDELTDYAEDWLNQLDPDRPFFLYVSHKAVHADFVPADRHRGRYDDQPLPITIPSDETLHRGAIPMWVRNQRNSRHGADFGYNLADFDPAVYYRRYCESLLAVDDGVGRLMQCLRSIDAADNTLVIYMGDNGFQFGDHGLIDKRTAYEASAKVPLLFHAPGRVPAGKEFDGLVAGIDIAPTILEATESKPMTSIDGTSFWKPLCQADASPLADRTLLYEYYWERNYPHTPTLHAVLGGRYKYIRCHGLWDKDELYDLQTDPDELVNLIDAPEHQNRVAKMNRRLWEMLEQTDGMEVPLLEDRGPRFPWRHPDKTDAAEFHDDYFHRSEPPRRP
ncbi:sulfatase family protein [Crateriforma conspicua]|uniref:sulfatase family protein n=1 Tax=Crateriforma conspicua TaxID=2527996 RepID=UPI00118A54A4|nr:sulfatase [Crateriforma conspicua]QDV62156.1 Arylsulfatase [Crateriforma conspicua]